MGTTGVPQQLQNLLSSKSWKPQFLQNWMRGAGGGVCDAGEGGVCIVGEAEVYGVGEGGVCGAAEAEVYAAGKGGACGAAAAGINGASVTGTDADAFSLCLGEPTRISCAEWYCAGHIEAAEAEEAEVPCGAVGGVCAAAGAGAYVAEEGDVCAAAETGVYAAGEGDIHGADAAGTDAADAGAVGAEDTGTVGAAGGI